MTSGRWPPASGRWTQALLCALLVLRIGAEELPGTRILVHGPLRVTVMDPAAPDRYNRGVRFCPLAVVLRASLEGHEFLHAPAVHDPVEDHGGLASEFDLCIPGGPPGELPPGFAEAAVGGGFLKIGVGVLAKEKEAYNLFQHPRVLLPATTTATWTADGARFAQVCAGSGGYAYELTADLAMADAGITVAWRLANTGTRPFSTRHYVHNFLCFDGHGVGPDYVLTFPYAIAPTGLRPEQEAGGREIRFVREIPEWVNIEVRSPADYGGPNTLTLAHRGSGLAVTCTTSIPGIRTAVHARQRYCSPEQFVAITLAPGSAQAWTRSWTLGVPGR